MGRGLGNIYFRHNMAKHYSENLLLLCLPVRLHWSKERRSKIKTDLDPTCDRCRQLPATLLHMFWSCPKLHGFCQLIFENFSRICGKTIHPSPLISLFGVVSADFSLKRCNMNTIAFGSLLARRLILFKWKHFLPPTYGQWIREVMSHIHLEKIRYTIKGSVGKFYTTWQPFTAYVECLTDTTEATW